MRCLERDPAARFQTTAELCAALDRARRRRRADSDSGAHQQAACCASRSSSCWCCSPACTWSAAVRAGGAAAARSGVGPDRRLSEQHRRPGVRPHARADAEARARRRRLHQRVRPHRHQPHPRRAAARQARRARGAGARRQAGAGRRPVRLARRVRAVATRVSVKATQAVTGNVIASARSTGVEQGPGPRRGDEAGERGSRGARRRHVGLRAALRDGDAVGDVARRRARVRGGDGGDVATASSRRRGRAFRRRSTLDPNFGLGYAGHGDRVAEPRPAAGRGEVHQGSGPPSRRHDRARAVPHARPVLLRSPATIRQCVKEYGDLIARYRGRRRGAQQPRAVPDAICANMPQGAGRDAAGRQDPAQARALPREPGALRGLQRRLPDRANRRRGRSQEPGTRSACWRSPSRSSGRASCRRRPQTYQTAREDRRARRVLRGVRPRRPRDLRRPVRRCGADPRARARPRIWRPRTPTGPRNKFAALAYAQLLRQQNGRRDRRRREGAGEQQGREDPVPGGAHRSSRPAQSPERAALAAGLAAELQAEPQAYAKIIEGEAALKNGRPAPGDQGAHRGQRAARHLDRPLRSRARVSRGRRASRRPIPSSTAASSGAARRCRCSSTRSPPTAIFPPVYYYQGRVREGLNSTRFAESYRAYLAIRGAAGEDPLLAEVRRRASVAD